MMNDQLGILESIKANEKNASQEDHLKNQYSIGKLDDFQEMMSDWQQHVGFYQVFFIDIEINKKIVNNIKMKILNF